MLGVGGLGVWLRVGVVGLGVYWGRFKIVGHLCVFSEFFFNFFFILVFFG